MLSLLLSVEDEARLVAEVDDEDDVETVLVLPGSRGELEEAILETVELERVLIELDEVGTTTELQTS